MHLFRPSTEIQIHTFAVWVIKLVIGAAFLAIGAFGFLLDYRASIAAKQALHTSHLAIFAAIAVLGLLVPFAPFVFPVAQKVSVLIAPYVPRFGRRVDDVPSPPGVAPGTPVVPAESIAATTAQATASPSPREHPE